MGSTILVQQLLDLGAVINIRNEMGLTPLLVSAKHGHDEITKVLLDFKADLEEADLGGNTALLIASREGHLRTVETLLDRGADVDVSGFRGSTPLVVAARRGHIRITRLLLEYTAKKHNGEIFFPTFRRPLIEAAKFGQSIICNVLLENGVDANERDPGNKYGSTALHEASMTNNHGALRTLLSYKAEVDSTNYVGSTALNIACEEGHLAAVLTLIQHGASMSKADNFGGFPLHYAALKNHAAVVRALLKQCNPNLTCDLNMVRSHETIRNNKIFHFRLTNKAEHL